MKLWTFKDSCDDKCYIYIELNIKFISIGILGYMIGIDF